MAQQPGSPSFIPVEDREAEIPVPQDLRRAVRTRVHVRPTKKSIRPEAGHRRGQTIAAADVDEGVGELHRSEDVGEQGGARTRPSKGSSC
jgi:hypothetical protein